MKITRALVSVANKEGIVEFVRNLRKQKIDVMSTGGTANLLLENNVKVTSVSDYTGFPEILDGRVKTLHPKIYGGLLAREEEISHIEKLKEFGISQIHMLVVNLYPFEKTISKSDCTLLDAIANIDIGGVSLIRAGSKNYKDVVVVTDPKDYALILEEIDKNNGEVSETTRLRLAVKAFILTAEYDRHIANYLYPLISDKKDNAKSFPPILHLRYKKLQDLRYGENSHQGGALYIDETVQEPSIPKAHLLQGKELSFNNIYDLSHALEIVKEFEFPVCVIIKHANPCGVGRDDQNIARAFQRALEADSVSAFGGIVAVNQEVSEECAELMSGIFLEAILAPSFDKKALALLEKKKNLRLLVLSLNGQHQKEKWDLKKIPGGLLLQHRDGQEEAKQWKVVSGNNLTLSVEKSLEFAWKIVKHVKSNAIVIANAYQTLGIGIGQTSRVEAVKQALEKAKGKTTGAVLASDGFFPFRDSLDLLEGSGISSVIQPGGSIKDEEVIQAAKEKKITMVLTAIRHFKH